MDLELVASRPRMQVRGGTQTLGIGEEDMGVEVKPGDWVTSYSAGIWQVYRVVTYSAEDPVTGKAGFHTSILSKRFLNGKMQRAFSQECCAPRFVEKLSRSEVAELNKFIAENSKLWAAFENHAPKPLSAIYNARITIPRGMTKAAAKALLSSAAATQAERISQLKRVGLWDPAGHSTAQFLSEDFEAHQGELVFTFARVF